MQLAYPTAPKPSTLMAILENTILQSRICGKDWPDDALYAVAYDVWNWPTYNKRGDVVFFRVREDLDRWIRDKRIWASMEDNYADWIVFEWDWGPVCLPHYECGTN